MSVRCVLYINYSIFLQCIGCIHTSLFLKIQQLVFFRNSKFLYYINCIIIYSSIKIDYTETIKLYYRHIRKVGNYVQNNVKINY